MKRITKCIVAMLLAAALLMGAAQAVVRTNANVNLRKGPGLDCEIVGDVKPDKELKFLGQVSTDDRGVDWYLVEHKGSQCWISSRYSELVDEDEPSVTAYDPAEAENWPEVSDYFLCDLQESAAALGLTSFVEVKSEVPNHYFDDTLTLAGSESVEYIGLMGAGYKVFGAACGMTTEEAQEKLTAAGLSLSREAGDTLIFEHPSSERSLADVDGFDSCINVRCIDGVVVSMDWSTYTG